MGWFKPSGMPGVVVRGSGIAIVRVFWVKEVGGNHPMTPDALSRIGFYATEVPLYSPATATAFRFALVVRAVRPPPNPNQASFRYGVMEGADGTCS